MAWRIALPLTVIAVALIVAIIICLFRKRQREKNRMCPEEETVREAKMQDPEPSGSSNLPFHERQHEDLGWREDRLVYVNLSLDPDSASPKLALSEDGKSVRRLPFTQELPDNPGRFDRDPCVLGREWLSSMRYYWEPYEKRLGHGHTEEQLCPDTVRRWPSAHPGVRPQENQPCLHLEPGLPASRTRKNKCLFYELTCLWYFLRSQS
ncbi:butyrophilin subfamily 2 member A1 isoform X3 [Rousettus aegyptiacus]|uniref:butyrophilin subfamily 2 member A1 isoform X3 n=1 Tax=Rousettus aegyptiacus TaxID=9407 RepID=UPI00168D1FFE|nr:butyrophilin subfamily 2 member A1 isoform X3 [Rousettus aegyptiacus]